MRTGPRSCVWAARPGACVGAARPGGWASGWLPGRRPGPAVGGGGFRPARWLVSAPDRPRGGRQPGRAAHDRGSGRGWLFTVAKRIVIDDWRAASRRPEVSTDRVPEQAIADTAQHTVDRHLVHNALRTLSIEHRQVLFECYFRDASVAQAASTLGVPAGTVKSRTHYALHALRQAIDAMGGVT